MTPITHRAITILIMCTKTSTESPLAQQSKAIQQNFVLKFHIHFLE